MPEGDTVYRLARRLHGVLAGELVTRFDLRVPAAATADLRGLRVDEVRSRGKHLLHHIGEWTVHTHLRMEGEWRVFRPGQRWTLPAAQARAVIGVAGADTVGFSLGLVEIAPRENEASLVGYLGPDLLGPDWDADEARSRLAADGSRPIAVALADQRNLAGLGNEYVNELCFLRGVLPTTLTDSVELSPMVSLASRLILANRDRPNRVTTGVDRPRQRSWVFGRAGQPCRRCGSTILFSRLGASPTTERDTYWCPSCQR